MAIQILFYRKILVEVIESEPFEEWLVEILVDNLFNITYSVPIKIAEKDIQTYLNNRYDAILSLCKTVYASTLSTPVNIVNLHLDMQKVKQALKMT